MKASTASIQPPAGALHPGRRRLLRQLLCGAALGPAIAIASAQVATLPALPAVVVWDFDDQTPRSPQFNNRADYLQRALSENLTAALLQVEGLPVVERQRLRDLLAEQKLAAGALADEDARLRLGRIVGAARMVFGGYFVLGDMVQVHVRLVDTATARVLHADEAAVPINRVMQTVEPLNRRLARVLAGADRGETAAGGRGYPAALWQAYDQALALADTGQLDAAVQALQAVLAVDKDFKPAERQLLALLEKIARR